MEVSDKKKLTYFSMFSGVGGFELGIQRAFYNKKKGRCGQEENLSKQRSGNISSKSNIRQYSNDLRRNMGLSRVEKGKVSTKDVKLLSNSSEQNGYWGEQYPVCVGYSEIDKYSIQTYEKNFGGHKNYGDATKIKPEELPDFDMLCGGTPCQDFSIAGKRKGLYEKDGSLTRSGLFYHFLRVAKAKKPKYILMENVKGMLSSKNKETGEYNFDAMMESVCDCGYVIDFTILNSKYFGVPQNRERVFILAIREDLIEKEKVI